VIAIKTSRDGLAARRTWRPRVHGSRCRELLLVLDVAGSRLVAVAASPLASLPGQDAKSNLAGHTEWPADATSTESGRGNCMSWDRWKRRLNGFHARTGHEALVGHAGSSVTMEHSQKCRSKAGKCRN